MTQRFPSELASFSDAVVVDGPGKWIHVSGQVGLGEDGEVVEGGMYEEALATLGHVERALARASAELSDVVRITAFLTDLEQYGEFSRARADCFGDDLPASVAVQVAGLLLGASVEIDAVAFVAEA